MTRHLPCCALSDLTLHSTRSRISSQAANANAWPWPARWLLNQPYCCWTNHLGALDLKLRRQMQDELKAIQKRVGTAFVHVTHDQEEAMALADHVVVMNSGRIEDQGTPERVYARPGNTLFRHLHGRKHHH